MPSIMTNGIAIIHIGRLFAPFLAVLPEWQIAFCFCFPSASGVQSGKEALGYLVFGHPALELLAVD